MQAVWADACISEMNAVRKRFRIQDSADYPLSSLDINSAVTSETLMKYGLSVDGYFDTIRVYRQAVTDTPLYYHHQFHHTETLLIVKRRQRVFAAFFLILSLLFATVTPVLITQAMTRVKNGATVSHPFPWFLADCCFCLLLAAIISTSVVLIPERQSDFQNLLVLLASTLPILLFELFANSRIVHQLSLDADTPLPSRSRIPLKGLTAIQFLFLTNLIYDPLFGFSKGLLPTDTLSFWIGNLSACVLPLLITLKGLGIVTVSWTVVVIPLPVFLLSTGLFDRLTTFGLSGDTDRETIFLIVILQLLYLPPALIADDVLPLPFWVWTTPLALIVFVVTALYGLHHFRSKKEKIDSLEESIETMTERAQTKQARQVAKKIERGLKSRMEARERRGRS
ncbi:hypothetical protein BLNAU_23210 [Blattamonas nauphoetae]|uniref:Uncharacterized protein n=1 Tax=Blattamonas nauphoetae TaxID=2049346 RepID=A0ABQ9WQU9_9EUKA|nr:hypothetical protein BLNAU_23210 [Blattamonas nauphoetae]